MEYARHESRMNAPPAGTAADAKDQTPIRRHLEKLAAKGNATAIAELEGPPFPETLDYLWKWSRDLHGKSGVGFGGLLPLSYTTIADWSRLTGREPTPLEVEALINIDAVMLAPGEKREDD